MGKGEWLGKIERSPVGRVACRPDSRPVPPSHLPDSLLSDHTHTQQFDTLPSWH